MKRPPPASNRLYRRFLQTQLKCSRVERILAYDPLLLDLMLLEDEHVQPVSAEVLHQIPRDMLLGWCHQRARYTVPTSELVDFLHEVIANRPAIEICAGCGDLGRLLGILMTDSGEQASYNASLRSQLTLVVNTTPSAEVEILDALAAVDKYRPEVVIASYATQLYHRGDEKGRIGSSIYGVDEEALLDRVRCYVHIGNDDVTKNKRILQRPHTVIRLDGLVTRAFLPEQNAIRIWGQMPPIDLAGRGSLAASTDEVRKAPEPKRKFVKPSHRQ